MRRLPIRVEVDHLPNIAALALRYVAWFIGLRVLYVLGINMLGLPQAPATFVILASIPAFDIGMQAVRRATADLPLVWWAKLWAIMLAIYAFVTVGIPIWMVTVSEELTHAGNGISTQILFVVSTGLMMALFLWIGSRAAGRGQ